MEEIGWRGFYWLVSLISALLMVGAVGASFQLFGRPPSLWLWSVAKGTAATTYEQFSVEAPPFLPLSPTAEATAATTYEHLSGETPSFLPLTPRGADGLLCLPPEQTEWQVDECADKQQYADLLLGSSSAENPLTTKTKKVKALFWSDFYYYTHMMSRMFYHIYEAASMHPSWEAHVWGPGFPGHRQLCYCRREGDTGEEWKTKDRVVECRADGDRGRNGKSEDLSDNVVATGVKSEDVRACNLFKLLSFAQHLEVLFNAVEEPFDLIIGTHGMRDRQWDPYFVGLSNHTVLVYSGAEIAQSTLKMVRKSRAVVVLHPYLDHYEENYFQRQWARKQARKGNRGAQLFFADPVEEVEHSFANEINYDALVGYAPHGVLPHCNEGWKDVLSNGSRALEVAESEENDDNDAVSGDGGSGRIPAETAERTGSLVASKVLSIVSETAVHQKPFLINLLGLISDGMYPTRGLAINAYKENKSGMADRIVNLVHPGYTQREKERHNFRKNSNCSDFLRQIRDKYELLNKMMSRSKICVVGIRSTWTLRKYIEAMAAGCLVVGDVPTDYALKDYVVDLKVTYPGFYNPAEEEDVEAVANLTGTILQPSAVASKPEHDVILKKGLYRSGPGNATELVAERLASILEDYDRGVYDEQIAAARRYAHQQASYTRWLTDWLLPAVEAHRAGERGWLRTPRYIRNHGRKYETRHRYILTEWLLRKEGLSAALAVEDATVRVNRQKRMNELLATPYEEFLDACEERLKFQYSEKCRVEGVCDPQDVWYYDGVSDFDLKYLAARELYSRRIPLDRYSHRANLLAPLYKKFSKLFSVDGWVGDFFVLTDDSAGP